MKQTASPTALGAFLRARRAQLHPEDFGFPGASRRRTPGLRREEVAQLCGISTTWLTWIEQGRIASVSVPTLMAIARGLKLSRAEREYLFGLAAKADPSPPSEERPDKRSLQQLVDLIRAPAYILDRYWDAVVWNRPASVLFPAWLASDARQASAHHNLLQYVFLSGTAKRQVVDWKQRAVRLVGEFRADTASLQDDPVRKALVHDLCEVSDAFAAAWQSQSVLAREGGERRFRDRHGVRRYRQLTLRVAHEPHLKLVVLMGHTRATADA